MRGLHWTKQQRWRYIDDRITFKDFKTKSQKNSFFGDTLGDRLMADINLTTVNSRPPTGRITEKESREPISDLKLTNEKNGVLAFGLCKRFSSSEILTWWPSTKITCKVEFNVLIYLVKDPPLPKASTSLSVPRTTYRDEANFNPLKLTHYFQITILSLSLGLEDALKPISTSKSSV